MVNFVVHDVNVNISTTCNGPYCPFFVALTVYRLKIKAHSYLKVVCILHGMLRLQAVEAR